MPANVHSARIAKQAAPVERMGREFLSCLLLLLALLAFLFRSSFEPGQVLFANDGPLGAIVAQAATVHRAFVGHWEPLNWIGYEAPAALPDLTMGLFLLI